MSSSTRSSCPPPTPRRHSSWWPVALLLVLVLAGCAKTPLYSDISELEANEMMSALLQDGVRCEKVAGKEGKWALHVPTEDFARAMERLKGLGLPHDKHLQMGEMFQKSGLVSSPTEERVRFMYGLQEEIAQTLMKIDGVLAARVHIVLPNNDPLGETSKPSSAAVYIKYRQGYNLESISLELKQLVTRSIEGLENDNVSIILMPGQETVALTPPPPSLTQTQPIWLLPAASALGGVVVASSGFLLFRRRHGSGKP